MRHLGHLHPDGEEGADGTTDHEACDDGAPVGDVLVDQRDDDGGEHAGCGERVAAAGGTGRAELLQAKDEEDGSAEVEELSPLAFRFLLEHLEHAIGDHEAADDVDHCGGDRQETEHGGKGAGAESGRGDGANDRDARNGVCPGHQRRVQGWGHFRNHLEANEGGEDEDDDAGDELGAHALESSIPSSCRLRG